MSDLRRALLPSLLLLACGGPGQSDTDSDSGESSSNSNGNSDTSAAASSTTEPAPTTGDTGVPSVRPNWHEDIAPLAAANCQSCHSAGGIAPFAMTTYEETKPWAPVMAIAVMDATMPPWHGVETDECQPPFPFKHDARLGDAEKALFNDWAAAGAPEGDPKLAAPLPEPPSLDLAGATRTVVSPTAIDIPAAGTTRDYFHCLSIDPGNAETVYLDGLQVVAGNRGIVHHVLIYVDAEGASASWPGGVKKNCGGGAGISGAVQLIGGWVPGGLPIETPADVGSEVPPGTRLIMNVHYHALAAPETDTGTGLALRWKTTAPKWSSLFQLIGAPGAGNSLHGSLMIPAGASGHIEEYEYLVGSGGQTIPDFVDVRLWAALNHMHKVGVDMRVTLEDRDTGVETCLLQTPRWDFNWQRSYAYDTPITSAQRVRAGDKVHVRCTYDNTLANPGVQEMLSEVGLDAPVDIQLGEGTLNEMCLTGLGVAIKGL
jgi:hypothetical protein